MTLVHIIKLVSIAVMLLSGIALAGMAGIAIRNGRVKHRQGYYTRVENPDSFWFAVGAFLFQAALLFGVTTYALFTL